MFLKILNTLNIFFKVYYNLKYRKQQTNANEKVTANSVSYQYLKINFHSCVIWFLFFLTYNLDCSIV